MPHSKKIIAELDKYMLNKQYDAVIKKCTDLYNAQRDSSGIYLKYILESYKNITINNTANSKMCVDAITHLKQLLTHTPARTLEICILQNEIGVYYVKANDPKTAMYHFKQILTIKNDIPHVFNNISLCHIALKEYKAALVCLNISLRLHVCDDVYARLGSVYLYTKQYDESIKAFESIQNPSSINLYNSCFSYLAKKHLLKGYELYENRLAINDICTQTNNSQRVEIPSLSYWNGTDVCNHLIIIYEQGIGDNIQYFRFIIELSQKFPKLKITYYCKSNVSHLFNVEQYENIIVCDDSLPHDISMYDNKLYIMSLPYILKLEQITLNTINYIAEDDNSNINWKKTLTPFANKLKVGIVYSGLLFSYIDKHIQLDNFKDICTDDAIQVFCLQQMDNKISNDFLNIDFADKIICYDKLDDTKPFVDTISLLRNIDILITIDTSIAHLAGVMGVKTLLLIGYTSEWRWFDTDDKIWYDSVQIIRMTEQKPLCELLPRVKSILKTEYDSKYSSQV